MEAGTGVAMGEVMGEAMEEDTGLGSGGAMAQDMGTAVDMAAEEGAEAVGVGVRVAVEAEEREAEAAVEEVEVVQPSLTQRWPSPALTIASAVVKLRATTIDW
ncbi:hypothetical protein GOP47_0009029 [Adiantum capillus-veneris]|uniref:Uncharacterized protein n=1 Tax=Adiantum capillus-veneris TaxID=13818 RepID=A0A9D4UZQ9_ADICA|nr:hypothetical protein GOP47_0009029 [Adiantum capillus-veneris]